VPSYPGLNAMLWQTGFLSSVSLLWHFAGGASLCFILLDGGSWFGGSGDWDGFVFISLLIAIEAACVMKVLGVIVLINHQYRRCRRRRRCLAGEISGPVLF